MGKKNRTISKVNPMQVGKYSISTKQRIESYGRVNKLLNMLISLEVVREDSVNDIGEKIFNFVVKFSKLSKLGWRDSAVGVAKAPLDEEGPQ